MAQTQRALLEFPASDAAFVETLAAKLGWQVITEGGEAANQDAAGDGESGETYKSEQIDWSKYSPEIQRLRRILDKGERITASDIAQDERLAYILSK